MTAAYRLRGLGWFAACSAIVLGFYLVSLQVASERNKLDALNARIRVAERDVRALETEFDTRANLQQLERWNGDVLALSAPGAAQFVRGEAQLASVRFDGGQPLPGGAAVRTAALVVPAFHDLAPLAVAPAAPAPVEPRQVADPVAPVRVAARIAPPAAAVRAVARSVTPSVPAAAPPAPRMQRVAMLDHELLSGETFGDLVSGARAEAGRRR